MQSRIHYILEILTDDKCVLNPYRITCSRGYDLTYDNFLERFVLNPYRITCSRGWVKANGKAATVAYVLNPYRITCSRG